MSNLKLPRTSEVIKDLIYNKRYIFSSVNIRDMYGLSPFYTYRLIRRLLREKLIHKLWRGIFILDAKFLSGVNKETLIDSLFNGKDYYFGLNYALLHWRMHDMPSFVSHVLTVNRSYIGRSLTILNETFKFVFINKKRFFGFIRKPISGGLINISDREKSLLDSILFIGRYVNFEDICKALMLGLRNINREKLIKYAFKIGSKALAQRLGYLLEAQGLNNYASDLIKLVGQNYVYLNPVGPKSGVKNSKWKIIVNAKC